MPNGQDASGQQPPGERLVRVETEIESIGRTLIRLDKTQERYASALEDLAKGFARMDTHHERISRNAGDVVALDREMDGIRDVVQRLEDKRIRPVEQAHSALETDLNTLTAKVNAKWWVIATGCTIGGFFGALLVDLIVRFFL